MSVPANIAALAGKWVGDNHLWLTPTEPVRKSTTEMTVSVIGQGKFLTMGYTWSEGGKPQDGLILFELEPQSDEVRATWVDSWHMGDKAMIFQGTADSAGKVSVKCSYPAPSGPDWGWQIVIAPVQDDTFQMTMYNITPEGESFLAVEASYTRAT